MRHFSSSSVKVRAALATSFFLISFSAFAQQDPWPPSWLDTTAHLSPNRGSGYQAFKGYIVLRSGDTLRGGIQLYCYRFSRPASCWFFQERRKGTDVPASKISYIRLHQSFLNCPYTELYTLNVHPGGGTFWRLIKKEGNIALYDHCAGMYADPTELQFSENNVYANEFNEHMILMVGGRKIKVYGLFSFFSGVFAVDNRSRELLVKFINRRYHQSFKVDDFKSRMAMVDYILAKEKANLGGPS